MNHILHSLEQKFDSTSVNVTKALLPIAVRWASTFIHRAGVRYVYTNGIFSFMKIGFVFRSSNFRSNSKVNIEPIEEIDFPDSNSISSNNTLFNFDYTFSSSSELNLSIALQSINDMSSLPLSALDNQEYLTTDDADNTSLSLTASQLTSDNESVLYLRLPNELNIGAATLDSDLERIDG